MVTPTAGERAARGRADPRAGFTMIELVVVLGILTLVAGMSIGVYRKVAGQNVLPVAASQVSSILRAARNYSISSGLPSRVYLDATNGRISAFGYELVASWSFEDLTGYAEGAELPRGHELVGAYSERAEVQGLIEVGDGRIGKGIVCLDEGASLVAERRPRYDAPRGFSLEAWVLFWPPPLARGEGSDRSGAWSDPRRSEVFAIVSRPGSWELGLLGDGAVYAVIGDADRPDASDTFIAATASREVTGARWTHVRASFDGIELLLEVDGIARGWAPEGFERVDPRDWPPLPDRVPAGDAELMISHPNRFFYGGLDEVKIRIALEPRTYDLPGQVGFLGSSRLIRFDSRGSLDPVHHADPVLVRVGELGEDVVESVSGGTSVGPTGIEEREAARRAEEDADLEEALGDPVGALARYLEEQLREGEEGSADDGTGLDPGRAAPGEGDPDAAARERGVRRVHSIIVDLTGTIRG